MENIFSGGKTGRSSVKNAQTAGSKGRMGSTGPAGKASGRVAPGMEKNESARRRLMEILDEAEKAKQVYPSFDLDREFEDPVFRRLLSAGVPVISAYELIHRDEVNSLLIEKAVRQAEKRIASAVSSGNRVPDENGSRPSAAAVSTVDPRNLTKEERKSIREKVRRGESVYF